MGRVRNQRTRATKNKRSSKEHSTGRRRRDIDQIQDDLKKVEVTGATIAFELDDDLPGLGQHYCTFCALHFMDQATLERHCKERPHLRR